MGSTYFTFSVCKKNPDEKIKLLTRAIFLVLEDAEKQIQKKIQTLSTAR